jgi:hypothetical protein
VEAAELADGQPVGAGEGEAEGVVVDHVGGRLRRREVEPRAGRVRRRPALHLVEVLLHVVGGEVLAVLEADAAAEPELQRAVVEPLRGLGQRVDDPPGLVDADRLLHGVPGDEQPVERRGVDDVHGADRLREWGHARPLLTGTSSRSDHPGGVGRCDAESRPV